MKLKLFNKATVKLMAAYTGVLMLISLGFSIFVGSVVVGEMHRPFDHVPRAFVEYRLSDDFIEVYKIRADSAEGRVVVSLVMINIAVLAVGLASSYFLARWTLRPIERAMLEESRFVSDASHELRTPLASMQMENEVLLRDKQATKDDYREQIKSNLEEVGKLSDMTNALLKLNRVENIELSDIDILPVVCEAIDRVTKAAEAKDIAIKNEITSFMVYANEDALAEILVVYLDNAIKYSPKGSVITISGRPGKMLSVSDQGEGIAKKDLLRIFDRFYRSDQSRHSEGYGLGLSLAKRLARQMSMRLSAKNNKNKGATFTINF